MAPVTLHNVSKVFGPVNVLSGINLTIEDGEFVVLVEPSGCGKSTLLRTIAGLEEVTGGVIVPSRAPFGSSLAESIMDGTSEFGPSRRFDWSGVTSAHEG